MDLNHTVRSNRRFLFSLGAVVGLALILAACAEAPVKRELDPFAETGERLAALVAKIGKHRLFVRNERIWAPLTLRRFYRERGNQPAWFDRNGVILPQAESLVRVIAKSDQEGLNPQEYHLQQLRSLWNDVQASSSTPASLNPRKAADLDLLLTDSFLIYGCHLLAGRTDPDMAGAQWSIIRRTTDLADALKKALDTNQIEKTLVDYSPVQPGYARLKETLARYRQIAQKKGWPAIPGGPRLRKGDTDHRVWILRQRLSAEGYKTASNNSDLFDEELELVVRHFQYRYGLDVDGEVGEETAGALNVPIDERIHQIKFNMDRWRWLPTNLGKRYVLVNIPDYMLHAFRDNKEVLAKQVIVGSTTPTTATPMFSDKITYLEFSPQWNVTKTVAVKEILPQVQKDAGFLARNNFEVVVGDDDDAKVIDPFTVQWSSVTADHFIYRFRQKSGPQNALGFVKFMFPNEFNVYIHGTSSDRLFHRRVRTFSHGCIRVEDPLDLAKFILNDPEWTTKEIHKAMHLPEPHLVPLLEPVPVYLVYWTVWVDENGTVHFRDDIYGRDQHQKEKFYGSPQTP